MSSALMLRNVSRYLRSVLKPTIMVPRCGLMASGRVMGPDHLDRTLDSYRGNTLHQAEVCEIEDISPTTKLLTLKVFSSKFTFLAGQWVDFFIPFVDKVGGFSFCSAPPDVAASGGAHSPRFQLAVKYSQHPPAHWVHHKCEVGSRVTVRVGGDFHFPSKHAPKDSDLLLLAGGVGINPLYSMYQFAKSSSSRATLLYSAKDESELLFMASIRLLSSSHQERLRHRFYVTQQQTTPNADDITGGRIKTEQITEALKSLDSDKLQCYICGPQTMIDSMEAMLRSCGVRGERIHYEKWW